VGGLATSALLAKYGVSSLLVERRREVFIYPEARNITFGQFSTYACSMVIGVTIRSGGGSERSGARVSAVLFGQRVPRWWISKAFPQLWVNPWAYELLTNMCRAPP
jgi:hypothetical protein